MRFPARSLPRLRALPLLALIAFFFAPIASAEEAWSKALPGWEYQFPRDHYSHPEFKTEWWYFTGHLKTEAGARYGYQITFFRQGLRPPGSPATTSQFVADHLHFAHFAISDIDGEKFHFTQKFSRSAFDAAGNGKPGDPRLAWIDDWQLTLDPDNETFTFRAQVDDLALDLKLKSTKPVVINGENGVSQKSAGAGEATHYYAMTRMTGDGTLTVAGKPNKVTTQSWLDREWGSNQLGAGQVGWDWFSLQLDDGRELMLYQLRRADGSADPHSSGTLTAIDGSTVHLERDAFTLTPLKTWQSEATPGEYPVSWRLEVPAHSLTLTVSAEYPAQELALRPVAYWEGAVEATGSHEGVGYLEMTGYAAPLKALQR